MTFHVVVEMSSARARENVQFSMQSEEAALLWWHEVGEEPIARAGLPAKKRCPECHPDRLADPHYGPASQRTENDTCAVCEGTEEQESMPCFAEDEMLNLTATLRHPDGTCHVLGSHSGTVEDLNGWWRGPDSPA